LKLAHLVGASPPRAVARERRRDFGYKVNMGMKNAGLGYPTLVQQVSGKKADALWAEYQTAIR
jgi:hypothetical protein